MPVVYEGVQVGTRRVDFFCGGGCFGLVEGSFDVGGGVGVEFRG